MELRDQLKAAIYGQESSSGKADTSKPNYAGAQGPMQVTGPTFEGMKASGLIPSDWSLSNPEQAREAGNRLVDQLMEAYGNDPKKAAAAYYAGPKAVNEDGTINDFHDLKNPKAPSTHQYVNQVLARMGQGSADFTSAGASPITGLASPVVMDDGWANVPSAPRDHFRTGHALKETPTPLLEPAGQPQTPVPDILGDELTKVAAAEQAKTADIMNGGVLNSARDQFPWSGIGGVITRALNDTDSTHPPVPGYKPREMSPDLYTGLDEAGQQYIDQARSPQEAELRRIHMDYRTSDMQDAAKNGVGTMIAGNLMGQLPEGYLTGLGATRLFSAVRSARTAMAIRDALEAGPQLPSTLAAVEAAGLPASRAGKFLSSVKEQAVGNFGSLAVQSQFDPYVSKEDYLMAGGMSILGAGLDIIGWHPHDAAEARRIGQSVVDQTADTKAATQAQAVANVGIDAPGETLRAEVQRLEAGQLNEVQRTATSPVPDDRRLMPDPEEVTAQVQHEHETAQAANNGEPALPDDLAGAKPRYSYGKKGFPLEFANDFDKAAYIAAGPTRSRADARYVKWAADTLGVDEAAMRAHGADVRASIKEQAKTAEPNSTLRVEQQPRKFEAKSEVPATDTTVQHPNVPDTSNDFAIGREPGANANSAVLDEWVTGIKSEARQRKALEAHPGAEHFLTEGRNLSEIDALGKGLHVTDSIANNVARKPALDALTWLQKKYLPDSTVHVASSAADSKANGAVGSFGKTHLIALREDLHPTQALLTAVHEFGHAVFHQHAQDIPEDLLRWMGAEHGDFLAKLRAGDPTARFHRYAEGSGKVTEGETLNAKPIPVTDYAKNFDEFTAEAFVRRIQNEAKAANIDVPKGVVGVLKSLWNRVKGLYEDAKSKGWLPKDEAFNEFFDRIQNGNLSGELPTPDTHELSMHDIPEFSTSLDLPEETSTNIMPEATVQQRAEKRMLQSIIERADKWSAANPIDTGRLSRLLKNTVFDPASSVMLRSTNPVMRMVAGELLENGAGAAGRRYSAAMGKWLQSRKIMGNVINDFQKEYVQWRNAQGGGTWDDYHTGRLNKEFNRLVALEIEGRQAGRTPAQSPAEVVNAANHLEAAYERARVGQVQSKTTGWASLPETSVGYMPHRMSRERVLNLTNEEKQALWSNLTDQFQSIEGFDPTFSANLAGKYIERVERAALGGYDAPGGIHQTGAAEVVEEALQAMNLSKQEVRSMMQRYMAAGPGHTKRRLRLDLTQQIDTGNGGTAMLMDLFETDQLKLLRQQADRVAGEVALTQHGVYGKQGLALLREAARHGRNGQKATAKEMEAFDQIAAEFMGTPFGSATGKWADRAMQFNSLARLGGMGIQQVAESINGIFHVGAGRTLESVLGMGRLRAEAKALARGEKVNNPILTSLEQFGGAEFGTDHYKMVFPFGEDAAGNELRVYGKDSTFMADRLLRGATHLQGKLSFWRAINSAQYRGMGEQIVHKAMKFIRDGGDDIALNDMGIHADLRAKLKAELPQIATFDGSGRLQSLDISKIKDTQAGLEFVAAVHRGVGQIIQNEHIGEKGVWAHQGWLRLLTQFRTFSITSIEKQWGRQVGNHGTAAAFGMMMGAMSIAAPLYVARTYLNSLGQKDPQGYIDKQLTAQNIARATLNYISMSGLAGDFMDATSAVTGLGQSSGGRAGAGKNFVGDTIAPSAGVLNDLYQGVQNTKNGTDPHQLMKAMPFANLPYLAPAVNALATKLQTNPTTTP